MQCERFRIFDFGDDHTEDAFGPRHWSTEDLTARLLGKNLTVMPDGVMHQPAKQGAFIARTQLQPESARRRLRIEGIRRWHEHRDTEGVLQLDIIAVISECESNREILKVPIGTIMSRLNRARGVLRGQLTDVARSYGLSAASA